MRRGLLLLVLLAVVTPAHAAIVYISGFEMGDPHMNGSSQCTPGGCDVFALGSGTGITQVHVRTGAWSYEANANFSDLTLGMTLDTISCRAYLYIPSTATSSNETIAYVDASNVVGFRVRYTGTHMEIAGDGGFSQTTGTAPVATDAWTRIDAIYDRAASGVGKVYVNGVLDIDITHTGTNGVIDRIHATGSGTTPPQHHYFDDVYCTDTLALSPAGALVARQGTTGTPIDNAFTKVNCTPIQDCWSDTGFSATSNANSGSTTLQVAQTMKVAPFSSAQTGHGSEVIDAGRQINAIVITAIAKNSAAGGTTANIRRYVNGAGPTDESVTLNLIDRGYKSSYFTDTAANLDLYEIGWMTPTTGVARTQTVEDMWMMVDFLPPSGAPRHRVILQ